MCSIGLQSGEYAGDIIVSHKVSRKTCRGGTGIILEKREPGRSRNIGTTTGRIIRSINCLAGNLPFTITSSDLKVWLNGLNIFYFIMFYIAKVHTCKHYQNKMIGTKAKIAYIVLLLADCKDVSIIP